MPTQTEKGQDSQAGDGLGQIRSPIQADFDREVALSVDAIIGFRNQEAVPETWRTDVQIFTKYNAN